MNENLDAAVQRVAAERTDPEYHDRIAAERMTRQRDQRLREALRRARIAGYDRDEAIAASCAGKRIPGVGKIYHDALRAAAPVVVVTRHSALVEHLREIGLIGPDAQVIAHATAEDVRGRHVIGVLPLRLAALAVRVTEIPLDLPPEARGRELTVKEVRQYAGPPRTYQVREEVVP